MGARSSATRPRAVGRAAGLGLGGATLLTLLSGCSLQDWGDTFSHFGWPSNGISLQAHEMYDLWIASVIAALAVGIGVWGLIFWCVIRYRKRGDELPVQTRFNMPMEILYTVTPVLIVAVLFYYTAIVQTSVDKLSKNPDQVVEVVAFKWNWQFNYRDGMGEKANTVASTIGSSDVIPILVLPVGEKIRFEETSKDVIHSFWVPEMLFKRDVFPGSVRNVFEVTLDKEGRYVGRCAELCGTYHAFMNFELVVVSPTKFDQFLDSKKTGASTQEAMAAIGFTGAESYATTTSPFNTRRQQHSWNQPETVAAGK
ncbi:putative cytochrome c oxidase subunit II [Actinoplanes missouriensis 431]|uniref:Cytochrome c oxidase subunit 2 n=1 Tax=Actinoplanes missouriensis (strain ATCC 14538 / DSM 43046 / CBS 188.64 / JCM 3121 / NBRC 102363 / NCIMB 12654 / NRRL B-3342 / UNCC 431) TaxID=512565 RepID=I0H0U8_ACTM4|nr:cytochrome c oxidase subunit II [Actinoplanes missouriensis]BAL86635.1 putative cytochrome c oxidase subunit II [Actinoplanes missouriensis 431]